MSARKKPWPGDRSRDEVGFTDTVASSPMSETMAVGHDGKVHVALSTFEADDVIEAIAGDLARAKSKIWELTNLNAELSMSCSQIRFIHDRFIGHLRQALVGVDRPPPIGPRDAEHERDEMIGQVGFLAAHAEKKKKPRRKR